MSSPCNIGIDVSKNSFDLFIHESSFHKVFEMNKGHIKKAISWLKKQKPTLIVLEATGGYERPLVAEMIAAKLPVAVVNPRQVRDFAKATGKLAKTDKIDSCVLAHFAASVKPVVRTHSSEEKQRLAEIISRRRQLVLARATEKNHKEHARTLEVTASIESVITKLTAEIEKIEATINDLIRSDPDMQKKVDILTSVPGIGPTTAAVLVSDLPELGTLNRKQIASLIGVAPINRDSGQFRGKRMTGGGRKKVRTSLFMAMLSVIQFNKKIRAFYEHLLDEGKIKMVALVAAMRKLIIILNSMLKNNASWRLKTA